MKCLLFSLPHFHFPFYIFLALIHLPPSLSDNKQWYRNCSVLFNCGSITGVDYPFWGSDRPQNCGYPGLNLRCDENILMIEIMNIEYRVLAIDQETKNLKIVRNDFMEGICLKEFVNTTLNYSLFDYAPGYENITLLYGCQPSLLTIPGKFTCPINGRTYEDGYVELGNGLGELGIPFPVPCQFSVSVPISSSTLLQIGNLSSLNQVIEEGFEVELKVDSTACSKCKKLNGQCGYDLDLKQFACLCPNQTTSGSRTCTGTNSTADDERSSPQSPPSASASGPGDCKVSVIVPVLADIHTDWGPSVGSFNITDLGKVFREGLGVKWKVNGTSPASTPSPGIFRSDFNKSYNTR
ncbi:hypothetical protein F0562_004208 [Nyssa sinensis]|uniref:non-specific serine/threonine protein kinase n=1 Tax=Nyssa sinensis TaxID=561372 RepID=A0A5J5BXY3_9ASTE|nr:hypothetical protein F0562_004208 [Nyssa sinensis]